jgi:two-component system, sensor histidine kinase and response regulator
MISIINASGNYLLETVDGILDMSKIEQGQAKLNPEPFDLDPFIKEVLTMMRDRAENSRLTLVEERSTLLPTRVFTDQVKLLQILINFIGNSVKFTESGGITLRLKSLGQVNKSETLGQEQPVRLQFEIIDTGCGIDEDEIPFLFEKFSQTASGRQSGQGTSY